MNTFQSFLAAHPLFSDLSEEDQNALSGCVTEQVFPEGARILKSNDPADAFYMIREGQVSLQIHAPHRPPLMIQTLGPEEVLGWSWMLPPYQWHFDAVAQTEVSAFQLDARCVRGKCEQDPRFGYLLGQCFSKIMLERLNATRLQLLDVYGHPGGIR